MSSSRVSGSSVSSGSSVEATHRATVLNAMQVSIKAEAVCDADVPPVEEKMPSPATVKSVISAMRQSLDAARAELKEVHTQMVIHEHAKKVALSRVRELEEEAAKKRELDAEKMQQEQEVAKKRKREQEAVAEEEIIKDYCHYFIRPLVYRHSVSSVVKAAAVRFPSDDRFDSITNKLRDDIVLDVIRVVAREKEPATAVTKP
jgi:hypothetical protein